MDPITSESRTSRRMFSILATLALVAGMLALTGGSASATVVSATFSFTGAEQTFTVPAGVTSIHVVAKGAAGGPGLYFNAPSPTGRGASVAGDVAVSPGSTLYVEVGGTPTTLVGCYPSVPCVGGFNGGGSSHFGGGGGGASDVRTVARADAGTLDSRLLVAAGGGGSGELALCQAPPFPNGGSGGDAGASGGTGGACVSTAGGTGGGAGTSSAGGTGGSPSGDAGAQGVGGNGGSNTGGGGGGGLYGGGGGGDFTFSSRDLNAAGGGGGGSNLVPAGGSSALTSDPANVTISYTPGFLQPDAQIKGGLASVYLGDDTYNQSGLDQTFQRKVRPGFGDQFNVKIENDSNYFGDSFMVTGSPGAARFKITYWYGGTDVTSDVVAGTFRTPDLKPGASVDLMVFIYARRGTRSGASITDLITATSAGDGCRLCRGETVPIASDVVIARLVVNKNAGDFNSQLPIP